MGFFAFFTRSSLILQKIGDEISSACTGPVSFPKNLADEKSLPVNQKGCRVPSKLVLLRDLSLSIKENGETQFEFLLKIFHQILRFLKADSQDCQTFLFELMK